MPSFFFSQKSSCSIMKTIKEDFIMDTNSKERIIKLSDPIKRFIANNGDIEINPLIGALRTYKEIRQGVADLYEKDGKHKNNN